MNGDIERLSVEFNAVGLDIANYLDAAAELSATSDITIHRALRSILNVQIYFQDLERIYKGKFKNYKEERDFIERYNKKLHGEL